MADRLDYYFRQKVTEAELDLGFDLLEQADRSFANDIGIFGIIDGMVAGEKAGVPDLTVDLTAPGRAYDQLGQRIFFGTAQNVDLSTDLNGVSTAVQTAGNEKIVSLFIKFDRNLSDPRTDGNSQQVFFRRDESFQFVVRQGAEAAAGGAIPPPLQPDEVLIVDVTRTFGQTQILNADLSPNPTVVGDVGRRQQFIFAEASAISVFSGGFSTLAPVTDDVQATLQEIDDELTGHFGALARRHEAPDVDAAATAGSPNALAAGTVRTQLDALLGHLNDHENDASGAHAASAIAYAGGSNWLGGRTNPATTVEAQLDKFITDLAAQLASDDGAERVGAQAVAGSPSGLAVGSVRSQLDELLGFVNAAALTSVAQTWTETQTFNGDGTDTDPALVVGVNPTVRKLAWEFNGGNFKIRLYYTDTQLQLTCNARWNGSQWERDSTGFFAARYIFARNDFRIQHVTTAVPQPFSDSEWAGANAKVFAFNIDGIGTGQTLTSGRERDVPSGPLTGYSATEGEWGSTQSNIGGGASFASGRLPAAPSSITFTVHSQFNTNNSPSAFVSQRMGVGWFDSVTGTLPHTSYMFLSFSAT